MVSAMDPRKFYGSSLPRPRIYTDVKFNSERVDPPLGVNDALLNWAHEAHWSMGGVNFTRHRFQGRIEGNVEKLRAQLEKQEESPKPKKKAGKAQKKIGESPSPPRAPLALKRRRVLNLVEEEDEGRVRRKLGGEFEKVARESGMVVEKEGEGDVGVVARRTRSKREEVVVEEKKGKKKLVRVGEKLAKISGKMVTRSSPRLGKN